jgi:hypothetical protein
MSSINESQSLLRGLIRRLLREDVYSSGAFSTDRLTKSIDSYASGKLASRGVKPSQAREVTIDDLRVAFGEMGYDTYDSLTRAIFDGDRLDIESEVRQILSSDFVSSRGPLASMNIRSLDDVLLPGDVDELVKVIVDDLLDGDGLVTIV